MNFLDLFSGIGGFRLGLERAGHTPVGWVEIDKFARQSYQAIHDTEGEWTATDITKVTDEEWRELRGKVDIIAGGFPCAPAGTKIKTIDGYKNIEDIKTGDMVLTHNGIYNPVVTPMNKQQNHYNVIKAQGVYGIKLTDEHPVYVYNQKTKETGWVEVKDLTSDMFLSMNINKESSDTDLSEDELWILGLYTADGWLKNDDNHKNVVIGIGEKKLEEFIKRVPSEIISSKRFRKEHNLYEFTLKKDYLYDYAKEIGSGAANKSVPQWIIDLKNDQLEKYLKGYLHGDGHWDNEGKRQMWTTTSEDLALTLQDIFVKLYKVIPSINVRVDDRSKNFKDTYNSQTRYKKRSNQFVVGDKIFTRIKSITRVSQPLTVYNMEVKNDNSYTTNNFIVHNCQAFSIAGKRLGFLDSTKGTLFFEVARAAKQIQPRYLFLENVKGLLSSTTPVSYTDAVKTINNDIKEHSELWETKRPLALKRWKELDDNLTNILLKKFVSENIFQKEQLDTLSKKDLELHLEQLGAKAEAGLMMNLQYCVTQISQTMKKSKNFQDVLMRVFDKQGEDIISSLNQLISIESLRTMDISTLETMVDMFVEIDLLLNNQLEESSEKVKLFTISTDEKQMTDQKTYSSVTELPTLVYIIRQWELLQRSWKKALLLLIEKKESTFYAKTFKIILSVLDELGYDVEWRVLNSKDFGVPQNRERVYIIGHLRGDSGREVFPIFGENKAVNQANVKQIGNLSDSKSFGGNPQTGRVYSDDGLSLTLNTMQGGGREPKVMVIDDQGRTNKKISPKHIVPTLRAQSHGNEPKVMVKEATKKGYDIATVGDSINIAFAKQNKRRGRVGHGLANTLLTGSEQATLTSDGRIRMLTPLECWRLQAFPDWAFYKAKEAGLSDSQLYKQAGNSVTVNVIEYIGKNFK